MYEVSNIDVLDVPTDLKMNRTTMYLHLTLSTNSKIDLITYIHCGQQTSHPVM